jgi:transcriptional regulator of heat shock response
MCGNSDAAQMPAVLSGEALAAVDARAQEQAQEQELSKLRSAYEQLKAEREGEFAHWPSPEEAAKNKELTTFLGSVPEEQEDQTKLENFLNLATDETGWESFAPSVKEKNPQVSDQEIDPMQQGQIMEILESFELGQDLEEAQSE